jgi:SAM-dependent methyltransferase
MTALHGYGRSLALRMLMDGTVSTRVAKLLVKPVAYWRTVEYAAALSLLRPSAGERVLDVSSPKLLALYLADRVGCSVVATDIEGDFVSEWAGARAALGLAAPQLEFGVEDGRALTFPTGSFDAVYSVSVVEHIPGDGDGDAMKEFARVLRPQGRLVLTVPFSVAARDEFVDARRFYWSGVSSRDATGRAFFQRRYDATTLRSRLIDPSGLEVEGIQFYGERILRSSPEAELNDFLPGATGPLHPLLARMFIIGPADDWRALAKPLCAAVLLRKR